MTIVGLQLGILISGAVVTETIFVLPGFGKLTLDAVLQRDFPLIQAVVLVVDVRLHPDQPAGRPPLLGAQSADPDRGARDMSTPELVIGGAAAPRIGRRTRIRRRFLRSPLAVTGLVLALAVRAAGDLRAADRALRAGRDATSPPPLAGPSAEHLLGTDELGRDKFSRIVYGVRASMQVGLLSIALAMLVGVPLGLIAGYFRGWIDPVISRLTDMLLAFPFLVLAVGLAAIHGRVADQRDDRDRDRADPRRRAGDAGRDAGAARGGLRARRGRRRRRRRGAPAPPHPAEPDERAHRPGDGRRSRSPSSARRCCRSSASACSRRRRRGRDAVRRAAAAAAGPVARGLPRHRDRAARRSPSTCSATACATPSTRQMTR